MTDLSIEQIARVCHAANRELQRIQSVPGIPVAPRWDKLTVETQESIKQGVSTAVAGTTAEQSHQNWVEYKVARGWAYGEQKSEEHKTHPLLVPYAQLPAEAKLKDHLFLAIAEVLA